MRHKQKSSKTLTRGFTIVELLVVIVVIGVLAAIAIVSYSGIQQQARDAQRKSAARTLQGALGMYHVDHGAYPNVCFDANGVTLNNTGTGQHCEAIYLSPVLVPSYLSSIPDMSKFEEHRRLFYAAGSAASGSEFSMYALAFGDGAGPGISAKCRVTSPGLREGDPGYSHFSPPGQPIASCY